MKVSYGKGERYLHTLMYYSDVIFVIPVTILYDEMRITIMHAHLHYASIWHVLDYSWNKEESGNIQTNDSGL